MLGVDTGDEDDLAAAATLDHVPGNKLTHVEAALQRALDHLLEGHGIVFEEVGDR